ncbi:MAG: 2Fe-2S iron-sulfur cluster-binding protein [Clostridium sp.]
MITLKINGIKCTVSKGTTILNVARMNCFNIPTLCNKPISTTNNDCTNRCGICVVELELNGEIKLVNSCCTEAMDNTIIRTLTSNVTNERSRRVQMLKSW